MSNLSERHAIQANVEKCIGCKKCEMACVSAHINLSFKEAKKRGLPVFPRIKIVVSAQTSASSTGVSDVR